MLFKRVWLKNGEDAEPIRWYLPDGSILQQAVVEIQEGRVVNYFEFREELPMTEWLGGEIRVERDEEGILRALWNGKIINKH